MLNLKSQTDKLTYIPCFVYLIVCHSSHNLTSLSKVEVQLKHDPTKKSLV